MESAEGFECTRKSASLMKRSASVTLAKATATRLLKRRIRNDVDDYERAGVGVSRERRSSQRH